MVVNRRTLITARAAVPAPGTVPAAAPAEAYASNTALYSDSRRVEGVDYRRRSRRHPIDDQDGSMTALDAMDADNRAVLANLVQMEKATQRGLEWLRAQPAINRKAAQEARRAYRHSRCRVFERLTGMPSALRSIPKGSPTGRSSIF